MVDPGLVQFFTGVAFRRISATLHIAGSRPISYGMRTYKGFRPFNPGAGLRVAYRDGSVANPRYFRTTSHAPG